MHVVTVVLLIFTMIVDGYDIFLVGIVLPFLAKDLGIAPAALTIVAAVQQFGLLLGNFVVGPIADRYGRRLTLLTCLTAVRRAHARGAVREHGAGVRRAALRHWSVPERRDPECDCAGLRAHADARACDVRVDHVRGIHDGHHRDRRARGQMARAVRLGIRVRCRRRAAVVLVAVLYFGLPESLRFLAGRAPHDPRIPRQLRRLDSALALAGNETFVARGAEAGAGKVPIPMLFRDGRAAITVLLWIGFHMAFIVSTLMGTGATRC